MEWVKIAGRSYLKVSDRILITRHATHKALERFDCTAEELVEKLKDKFPLLYKITPTSKQVSFTVRGVKLILEKMTEDGNRCPKRAADCYLVVVSFLLPTMTWRGDRSKFVRRKRGNGNKLAVLRRS